MTTRLMNVGTTVGCDGNDSGDPDKKRFYVQKPRGPLHLSKSGSVAAGSRIERHEPFHNTFRILRLIKAAIGGLKSAIEPGGSLPIGYFSAEYFAEENRERVLRRLCG